MDGIAILFVIIAVVGAIVKTASKTAQKRPGQSVPSGQQAQTARQKMAARPSAMQNEHPISWEEAFPPEVREVLVKGRRKGVHPVQKVASGKKTPPLPKSGMDAAPSSGEVSKTLNRPDDLGLEERRHAYANGDTGGSLPHEAPDSEGKSRTYDDGCVGGSLPHERSVASARMKPRIQAADTAPILLNAASPDERKSRLTAAEMRRAVVMAEVLARPVALRPHGYRL